MDRDTMSKLRLDRRLLRRRGWISDEDLTRELESLPDVAEKIAATDAEPAPTPGSGTEDGGAV